MNNKLELYYQAKEAYYAGNPIMEDFEFDALEKELGLENKSYVGTKHNPSYTIEHPFMMGSLSKVQIHEKDGVIDWLKYYYEVADYAYRNTANTEPVIITPKYDGCSFEIQLTADNKIEAISTRGDGEYGRDIKNHIYKQAFEATRNIDTNCPMTLRGEVLIDKNVFAQKYSNFVNPRSFVAGILNRDIDWDEKGIEELLNDLSIVIYEVRMFDEGNWIDCDWFDFDKNISIGVGYIPNQFLPSYYIIDETIEGPADLDFIYNEFAKYRQSCPFALDGIVVKPVAYNRMNNLVERRPKDCVAIKFIPMLEETEIVDIEWNLGKTGELNPVVITKPVNMDGKNITRASGHNYGYLLDNKLSIGSKIILSLAGDIIPFIYKVTNTDAFDDEKMNVPENTYVEGCHLMALLSEQEQARISFISSAKVLNIPGFGTKEAENVFDYIIEQGDYENTDIFFDNTILKSYPKNILEITPSKLAEAITDLTSSKSSTRANKIMKEYNKIIKNISLSLIIQSFNFRFCGSKVAEQCAAYLIGTNYSFEHLPQEGYEWCLNENNSAETGPNEKLQDILNILSYIGKSFNDFKNDVIKKSEVSSSQIPVILTGEPNDYNSKGDFLKQHPEYRMTGSWKEVKIVFTNSLESNTGKMKKAKEKGIEIKLY